MNISSLSTRLVVTAAFLGSVICVGTACQDPDANAINAHPLEPGADGGGAHADGAILDASSDKTTDSPVRADARPGTDGAVRPSLSGCPSVASDPDVTQELPIATVDTALPSMGGNVVSVRAGANLQAAIDAAQPGDTLELEAGATFDGPVTLPNKTGNGWIVIRTSTPDAQLATPGTRVSPALAPKMARVVASESVIQVAKGAHHFRFIGIEVAPAPGTFVYSLVDLGVDTQSEAELAHDLILDRVYLHADPAGGRRGIALNSKSTAIIDSYISGFREHGSDSQAICGWTGPGPYRIVNNYLEAASENIMFGGADPRIPNLVPSDIQICGNHVKKDLAWKGADWNVKNLFELKNARRVVVAGNVMEFNWPDGQSGFAVLFTPRNQDGTAAWSTVEDVTFAYNIVRHSSSGVNIAASDSGDGRGYSSQPSRRLVITNNLFDDIGSSQFGGDGRAYQFVTGGGGGADIKIDHNTTTTAKSVALMLGDTGKYGTNFIFTNNVVARGEYGVFGSGQGEGTQALDFFLASYTMTKNVFFGTTMSASYPAGNFVPATSTDVAFVNAAAGQFDLGPTSKYLAAGTDGKDLGADISALTAATNGAVP